MTRIITKTELEKLKALGLPEVHENNQWLVLHIKGDSTRAPATWNAKVYKNNAGDLKLVTTDTATLETLLGPSTPAPRIISIDDSGWGYPLGGVLIGIHDSQTGKLAYGEIPVDLFKAPTFDQKHYLSEAAKIAKELIEEINKESPITRDTEIRVCTGYVNRSIPPALEDLGFKNVHSCEIGEPLQTWLERAHREYIAQITKTDLYYDPKDLPRNQIGKRFNKVISWLRKNNAWSLAKTGWGYFKRLESMQEIEKEKPYEAKQKTLTEQ